MNEFSETIVSAPVVILAGAGASVPLAKATTEGFMDRVAGLPVRPELLRIFQRVRETCAPSEGVEAVDIEVVLDHLSACIQAGETFRGDPGFRAILFGKNPPQKDLDTLLAECAELREALLDEVVRHYGEVDEAAAGRLYRPLLAEIPRRLEVRALPLFTLNYDLAVESAAAALRVRIVDGVDRGRGVNRTWSPLQFHRVRASRSKTIALFKLHGSVSWCTDEQGTITEVVGLERDPRPLKHVLMYPSLQSKNLQGEPWSTAYGYLRACLNSAKVALIIGTSLRDAELVDALKSGVDRNPALALALLSPSADHEAFSDRLDVNPSRVAALALPFGGNLSHRYLAPAVCGLAAGRKTLLGRTISTRGTRGRSSTLALVREASLSAA